MRYNRQIILPEIGVAGQEKISKASVLCIGAGGLGSPALLYLAAAGVGRIGIIDFDVVDESNLQRQILFTVDQIGQNKALAAKARLQVLNPEIEIEAYPEKLNEGNAPDLFARYDVIVDGTDNFAGKFLINDAAVKIGKPFVYGSILGFEGQAAVFNYKGGPCYRCLFPEPPRSHIPNCAEAGVIGAVAGMIGTLQAMEALKIIVEHENLIPLSGQLYTLDARTMRSQILSLPKDPACCICSKTPDEIVLSSSGMIVEISPQHAQKNTAALLLDVRERDEWDAGHIEGAEHFALSALMAGEQLQMPKDRAIILYCQKGKRSQMAAQILKAAGYTNLSNMTGGYDAWLELA